jgi:small subunit ribosomal protein S7
MSRRHAAEKREVLPDVKYNSILVAKFVNNIMSHGKKELAEKIVYGAFDIVKNKHRVDPFEAFNTALSNVRPHLEVTSVRVGGANYQVPSPVDERRGCTLASRWIIDAAKKRSGSMIAKLAEEIFEASNNRGSAVKKREDTHKMAEANKAFSHFSPKKSGTGNRG